MTQVVSNLALAEDLEQSYAQKQAIQEAFSKAAKCYDQHAQFQRTVANRLLDKLPNSLQGLKVLDLGCGTGFASQLLANKGAKVIAADLSEAMLEQSRLRCENLDVDYQQADAEQLPFKDNEFDIVYSSLALQWCQDLSVPLKEMKRVTKPGGSVLFSTLLDGSLEELKSAWLKVDSYQHVNDFISPKQVKLALAQSECALHHIDSQPITVCYSTALALMKDLKGIGANHVQGRSQGLMTRKSIARLEQEYSKQRNSQGQLPATYQVCFGVITA
ncbi:malonyl-ACP O-methyltransferase BioC [Vibrio sp. SCSIO 43136]|uniref:malonyl-ACP O-methyltransferase BioC n=1 Tax=Vibrio sp. SCSIO 43136 TaxID=2819101 RepID=UPI0020763D12|nr:malonyl-ACP O-methyltransferase BioC [Vibrio sp. SCSIO 43136]USD64373.1 malonyl-ACP O-methyltransferase BioC [Vibrio sp. SCSIO 43136]